MPRTFRTPDAREDTGVGPGRESITGTSRWQKVVGIIGLVVLLAFAILRFGLGGGGNGPSQDTRAENQEQQVDAEGGGEHEAPPWVPEDH